MRDVCYVTTCGTIHPPPVAWSRVYEGERETEISRVYLERAKRREGKGEGTSSGAYRME